MARVYVERRDLPDDLQRLLDPGEAVVEYTPPIDVIETETAVQVLLDLPGVEATQIEVVFSRNVLVISGEKTPSGHAHGGAAYHVAERAFGRFARAIGVEGAFDVGEAVATLKDGELRLLLPRLAERRGGKIRIPVL
jgi:HSP20 family protein